MTREEAIDIIRDTYHTDTELEALKVLLPELQESEDERIRKELIGLISCMHDADPRKKRWIAWLEKQKEQPQEELVYRMNGLMQEYIKEGEDDAGKEHRLKCYQLFWDALEDADFFEQKEQKPEAGKASSWKPSEEQMEALSETIAFAPDTFKPKCTLVTLQDDLKNL